MLTRLHWMNTPSCFPTYFSLMQLTRPSKIKQNVRPEKHIISSKTEFIHKRIIWFLFICDCSHNYCAWSWILSCSITEPFLINEILLKFNHRFDIQHTKLNFYREVLVANALQSEIVGAAHLEDIGFLFTSMLSSEALYKNLEPDSIETKMIKLMRAIFINFVKFGWMQSALRVPYQ